MRNIFETEFNCIKVKGSHCPSDCRFYVEITTVFDSIVLDQTQEDMENDLKAKVERLEFPNSCPLEARGVKSILQ